MDHPHHSQYFSGPWESAHPLRCWRWYKSIILLFLKPHGPLFKVSTIFGPQTKGENHWYIYASLLHFFLIPAFPPIILDFFKHFILFYILKYWEVKHLKRLVYNFLYYNFPHFSKYRNYVYLSPVSQYMPVLVFQILYSQSFWDPINHLTVNCDLSPFKCDKYSLCYSVMNCKSFSPPYFMLTLLLIISAFPLFCGAWSKVGTKKFILFCEQFTFLIRVDPFMFNILLYLLCVAFILR